MTFKQNRLTKALFDAACANRPDEILSLARQGADIYARNELGDTATLLLARNSHEGAVVALARAYPFVLQQKTPTGASPIIFLAFQNKADVVVTLAKMDPTALHHHDNLNCTAATWLAFHDNIEALLQLVQIDPEILYQGRVFLKTFTLLFECYKNPEALTALIEAVPQIKQRPSVIADAIFDRKPKVVKALMERGFACPHDMDEQLERAELTWDDINALE